MKKEIWKDVKGYEGYYKVSNKGRVRSLDRLIEYCNGRKQNKSGIILKLIKLKNGYLKVNLSKDNKRKEYKVHRLVAENFIKNKNNNKEINHIDGNKENNSIENLEWCTSSENQKHAFDTGLQASRKGEQSNFSKLKKEDVIEIKKLLINTQKTQKNIGKMFGVSNRTISSIKRGINWSHITIAEGDSLEQKGKNC